MRCCTPRALRSVAYIPASRVPHLSLPKMDFDETTRDALFQAFNSGYNVSYAGNNWGGANDVCDYIESGSMSISWNGDVSPCWPLMHTHIGYLNGKERKSIRHVVGNVRHASLRDLWLDPEYLAYRSGCRASPSRPASFCGGCDPSVANGEDCLGNQFPERRRLGRRAYGVSLGRNRPLPYAFLRAMRTVRQLPCTPLSAYNGGLRAARFLSVTRHWRRALCRQRQRMPNSADTAVLPKAASAQPERSRPS